MWPIIVQLVYSYSELLNKLSYSVHNNNLPYQTESVERERQEVNTTYLSAQCA